MKNIAEPYVIHYPQIVAVADVTGSRVELIEFFDCVGGAMWSKHHYAQSPVVEDVRCVGATMRYLLKPQSVDLALEGSRFPAGISACTIDNSEIAVTYIGMGGGGVGAAACRSESCEAEAIPRVGEKLRELQSGCPGCSGCLLALMTPILRKKGQHGPLSIILPERWKMSIQSISRIRSSSSFR
jgi:tRNA(Ile2) C34 agmatinyltransferase TiaS